MGSKSKIAKYILPIILKNRQPDQWYVEPFVGGCNMIDKVDGPRQGSDMNQYLIDMWKGLQDELKRPQITREKYDEARMEYNNGRLNLSSFEIGYIGWMGSFNGRFFDGGFSGTHGKRDYIDEQVRNTMRQVPLIKDVDFRWGSYGTVPIPKNSIIYCDPPYKGTKQYSVSGKNFDYDDFWKWCRERKKLGHEIFISEYSAPDDFKCIWQMQVTNSMNTTKTYKPVEKLFTL